MKFKMQPKHLKFAVLGAGLAALALRAALYAAAIDGRGLFVPNHPLSIALWGLSVFVLAALLLLSPSGNSAAYADAYPASVPAFLGCVAAAAGLAVSAVLGFGEFQSVLDIFIWVLGLGAAAALVCIGVCRLLRAKPYFLLHAVVCVYLMLRLVSLYRRWSADPCLQDYFFYLMAHLALMLTAYHHAAFDAAMGKHRALWGVSLAGVYLSCAALYGCEEPLLMAGCAAWCFTNLTSLRARARRTRPALKLEESGEQEA